MPLAFPAARRARLSVTAAVAAVLVVATPAWADPEVAETTRVSTATGGTQGDSSSYDVAISADGRYVAYASAATNLVAADTNGMTDIFLTDTTTGTTTRVSTATGGTQSNGHSYNPAISADGRYIAYSSDATNLVADDTNSRTDIFLTDTTTGTTTRVSTATGGTQSNGHSYNPAISADGRYITYYSSATNLVADDTNSRTDIFLTDSTTGTTTRISTATGGVQSNGHSYNPAISADGRYITYYSSATNLVADDTNGIIDVFLTDTTTGTTTRISTATDGVQSNGHSFTPAISADGRYITYYSDATNLVADDTNGIIDIFLTDTTTGTTTRISTHTDGTQSNGDSYISTISADGRYVTYYSNATNLVADDTNGQADVFLTGTTTGTTTRISTATDGTQSDDSSDQSAISADGRYIAYVSLATNLVDLDTNGVFDIFRTEVTLDTASADPPTTSRIAGVDRFATSAATAQEFATADTVYVAYGLNYPDALSAAPAAAHAEGPLLLTHFDSLPGVIADEIVRLDPDRIVVVGGTGVISAAVEAALEALQPGPQVERIAGADRYETSRLVTADAFTTADTAFIATGTNFPDALAAAAAAAAHYDGPVILTNGTATGIDQDTLDLLDELNTTEVLLAGGTGVVSSGIEASLETVFGDSNVRRLAGADRYGTSIAINVDTFSSSSTVYLAVGTGYADALSGAALAGRDDAPLFVVPGTCVPEAVLDAIADFGASSVVLFGGTGALSAAVADLTSCT